MVRGMNTFDMPEPAAVSGINAKPGAIPLACFRLAGSLFAVDVMRIMEIAVPGAVRPPLSPSRFVTRDAVLRGKTIPVMDLRGRFRIPPRPERNPGELIVVRLRDGALALGVDEVVEIIDVPCERIMPPPDLEGFGAECILGVCRANDDVVMIVDIDLLLNGDRPLDDGEEMRG